MDRQSKQLENEKRMDRLDARERLAGHALLAGIEAYLRAFDGEKEEQND